MGKVLQFRPPKRQKPAPEELSIEERMQRVKESTKRIQALLVELKEMYDGPKN